MLSSVPKPLTFKARISTFNYQTVRILFFVNCFCDCAANQFYQFPIFFFLLSPFKASLPTKASLQYIRRAEGNPHEYHEKRHISAGGGSAIILRNSTKKSAKSVTPHYYWESNTNKCVKSKLVIAVTTASCPRSICCWSIVFLLCSSLRNTDS